MASRKFSTALVVLAAGILGLLAGAGHATGASLGTCATATAVIPESGGASVVAGGCPDRAGNTFIARVLPNGKLDRSFGEGGISKLGALHPGMTVPEAMRKVGGKYMLAGSNFALRFDANGSVDTSYGNQGVVSGFQGAEVDIRDDGQLITTEAPYSDTPQTLTIRRFDENGQPVAGFGTDGVVSVADAAKGPMVPALKSDGSFALAYEFGSIDMKVRRFTPAGQPDGSFGTGGVVDLTPDFPCVDCSFQAYRLMSLRFEENGNLRILANASFVTSTGGKSRGWDLTLGGANGQVLDSMVINQPEQPMLELPGGDLVGSFRFHGGLHPYKYSDRLNVARSDADGGKVISSLKVGPRGANVNAVAFDQARGQLVVVGDAEGPICSSDCVLGSRALVTRINADTGKPVNSFGTGGTMLLSASCPTGRANGSSKAAWPRCSLHQMRLGADLILRKANRGVPSVRAVVTLGNFKNAPYGSTFQTSISLPKGWKFTRKAKSRSTARASFWFLKRDRPATGVRFKGREVRVTYRYPDGDASWPGEQGPEPFYDQLTFRIELKRGAIVRTRNAAVGRSFKVRGRISPTPALRWYGPTQASKTVRAR